MKCINCGGEFEKTLKYKKYCSIKCRRDFYKKHYLYLPFDDTRIKINILNQAKINTFAKYKIKEILEDCFKNPRKYLD